jgi:hypothetical protein
MSTKLRVLMDTSLLRRPHAGSARWINGLLAALSARDDLEMLAAPGPGRVGNGLLFRPLNLARQRWWYESGMQREAQRRGARVMLMPAGYACRRGPVPQVTAILDVNFLTQPGTYEPLMARYLAWVFRRATRDSAALVTISDFSRHEIAKHLGVRLERL